MKRILCAATLVALWPAMALAQTTINPNAKVDPKNSKVSRPVVEKAKVKLLTRDELRTCMKQKEANEAEARAVKEEQVRWEAEHEQLKRDKEQLTAEGQALNARMDALVAERTAIAQSGDALKAKSAEMKKADFLKASEEYSQRAKALDEKIVAFNADKSAYNTRVPAFDARIAPHNEAGKKLETRSLDQQDAVDAWRKNCMNKSYDELDEIAIKKEMAAGK